MAAFRRIQEAAGRQADTVDLPFAAAVRGKVGFIEYVMQFRGIRATLYAAVAIAGVGILGEAYWAVRTHLVSVMAALMLLALALPFALERYGSYSMWLAVRDSRVVAFGQEAMYIADRRSREVIRVPLDQVVQVTAARFDDPERAQLRDGSGSSLLLMERLPFASRTGSPHAIPTVLARIAASRG